MQIPLPGKLQSCNDSLINQWTERKSIANDFGIDYLFQSFFKEKCQTFPESRFSNVRICCFLSFMIINEESLDFGQFVGKEK